MRTNWPVLKLTAPKQATALRAGACCSMGSLDYRWYPHAAARTMLLEVTFIQAPQFEVGAASHVTAFFLLPRLSADRIGRLGGAACAAENPFVGTGADIAAPPGRRRIADAGAPTIPDRPSAWRPDRSRAEFYANRPAAGANPSHPEG